jgi:hypothetical protein
MPIPRDYAEDRIGNPSPGSMHVFVGPCSVMYFRGDKIPLDGRKYACDGRVMLRSGHELRAKFELDTTKFDFIVLSSVIVFHESQWYR